MNQELNLEFLVNEFEFKPIGKWERSGDKISYKISDNNFPENEPAVYAFVIGEKIMYIGKATYKGYKSRFNTYVNIGNTTFTNFRCNKRIKAAIASKDVLIYVHLADTQKYGKSKAIEINLADSLEKKLVKILKQQDEVKNKSKPHSEDNYSWNWTDTELERIEKKLSKSPSKHSE